MKRFAAHWLILQPGEIMRDMVVEIKQDGTISKLMHLKDLQSETSATCFLDGIITPAPFSLSANHYDFQMFTESDFRLISEDQGKICFKRDISHHHWLVDFGTDNIGDFNRILQQNPDSISGMNLLKFIEGCCINPYLFINRDFKLISNRQFTLVLWENTDLSGRKLRANSMISALIP